FHHVKSFTQFFIACSRMEKGLPVTPPTYNPEQLNQDFVNFELPFPLGIKTNTSQEPGPSKQSGNQKGKKHTKHASTSADEDSDGEVEDDNYDKLDASGKENNEEQVDTPPSTPKLQKNRRLGPNLQAELESMETKERRLRM
ncbi:hypothetical protein K435DRAFT_584141, partial [Dendrothele bispora CBS 962.96]